MNRPTRIVPGPGNSRSPVISDPVRPSAQHRRPPRPHQNQDPRLDRQLTTRTTTTWRAGGQLPQRQAGKREKPVLAGRTAVQPGPQIGPDQFQKLRTGLRTDVQPSSISSSARVGSLAEQQVRDLVHDRREVAVRQRDRVHDPLPSPAIPSRSTARRTPAIASLARPAGSPRGAARRRGYQVPLIALRRQLNPATLAATPSARARRSAPCASARSRWGNPGSGERCRSRLRGVPQGVGTLELFDDLFDLDLADAMPMYVGGGELPHRLEYGRPVPVARVRAPRRPRSHRRLLTPDPRIEHPIDIRPADEQLALASARRWQRALRNPQPDGGGIDAQLVSDFRDRQPWVLVGEVVVVEVVRHARSTRWIPSIAISIIALS